MFKLRTTILLCLLLTFTAAGSYLVAAEESDKPEAEAIQSGDLSEPEEGFDEFLQDLEDPALLALVPRLHGQTHNRSKTRANHEERISRFRLWRIMEELELTDDQVDKFFPLMRQMMKKEQELAEKKRGMRKSLREELKKEKPSDKELERLITEIRNQAKLAWQGRENDLDQFAGLLTANQRARLLLALNNVERDVWESIARARMASMFKPEFKFDRVKIDRQMKELRKNLDSLNIRLKIQGLPGIPEGTLPFGLEDIDEELEETEEEKP